MNDSIERFKKLSASSVSDALDSLGISGGLIGIRQQVAGTKCVGPAFTVEYMPINSKESGFRNASNYIDDVSAGAVIVIDNQGKNSCTAWGDILTEFSILNGIAGTVVHGAVRDIGTIRNLNYPLFSSHIFMQSGKNRIVKRTVGEPIRIAELEISPRDLIFADENGCLCIPKAEIKNVLERAERTEKTEDQIKQAISKGMALAEARKKYAYNKPWEKNS